MTNNTELENLFDYYNKLKKAKLANASNKELVGQLFDIWFINKFYHQLDANGFFDYKNKKNKDNLTKPEEDFKNE